MTLGKLSKQRRYQRRKDAMKIADLTERLAHTGTLLKFTERGMDSAQRRESEVRGDLRRMVEAIREVAGSASYALPAEQSIGYGMTRVAAQPRRGIPRLLEVSAPLEIHARDVLELTHFILDGIEEHSFSKALHFKITNAPGGQNFRAGYALTHEALHGLRDRNGMVRMICEQFGYHIYKQLFPHE
jgi:hypothetical protein